ncbi:MAG: D-cysteine desulfhydrase family protein [Acidimicrobiia bacterium]
MDPADPTRQTGDRPGWPGLAHLPTPIEPADRLGAALGLAPGRLWVKRDDCTGLAGGGNKARKLEPLCADALAHGCDTLVTGGGPQSNHVRMTAAAASRLGLSCTALLAADPPADDDQPEGNVLLDVLFGADIRWIGDVPFGETEAAIRAEAGRLERTGRHCYPIPIGGASPVGEQGYVRAAREIDDQLDGVGLVVTADGSGGTHAGLAAGFGSFDRVLGVDVGARPDLAAALPAKAATAAARAGLPAPEGAPRIVGDQVGERYGVPTPAAREALDLAARCEGLVLDPVYTGKALAGLVAAARSGRLPAEGRIVFLHTGGMPALFAEGFGRWIAAGPRMSAGDSRRSDLPPPGEH